MTDDRISERGLLGALLVYLALTLGAAACLAYAPQDSSAARAIWWPTCAMRRLAGIPCPLCFGTTTYVLIWRGHGKEALSLNPFAFGLFWLSFAAIPVLSLLMFSRRCASDWMGRIRRPVWVSLAAVVALALVVNWFYLIATQTGVSPEAVLGRFP
jgi:hypothetical protein